jgi:DHA2 family multidrug resistance protein
VENTQANHAAIAPSVNAVNRGFEHPLIAQAWNPLTAAGRAALDAVITRQAEIIAYIDDYKLLMIAVLAVIPLLIVFRKPPPARAAEAVEALARQRPKAAPQVFFETASSASGARPAMSAGGREYRPTN